MPLTLSVVQALICFGVLAGVAVFSYRSLVSLSPWRRWTTTLLRSILVLFLLFAVFEVKWKQKSDELAVLFVLDYSDSVSVEAKSWAQNYLKAAAAEMNSNDRAGLLVFGEETFVEIAPTTRDRFQSQLDQITTLPSTTYTNIARAVRLALAVFPEGVQRRIVLLTDGEENLGNARDEALVASAGETPIEVIPLSESKQNDALIERLLIPPRVQQDSAFEIKMLTYSTKSGPAQVQFFQNGHYLGQKTIELRSGKNVFAFPQKIERPGFHTFEARIEVLGDTRSENNVASGFTIVQGAPKVLYLSDPEEGYSSPVPRFLQKEGILVDARGRASIPSQLSELQNYDCLVLDNISAVSFSQNQMRIVERYVHDLGGGLVMVGGRNSFGPGGYLNTPIEETLPVEMAIKDKRHFPSFAQVIVIDKSGSMGMRAASGKEKIELAAEGAIQAVELLNDQDWIGVIATDTQPKWIAPLRKAENRSAIIRDIATLRSGGGGIYVYTGLKEAYTQLSSLDCMLRHIILFADGSDAEQHEGCDELVRQMIAQNMTLTSVSLGQGQDVPFLTEIAERTGGRFHLTEDGDQIPRIFTKETILAQRSYLIEEPFVPVLSSGGTLLRGLAIESSPALLGYVGTSPKDRAEVLLVSHRADPVLATWRYGLGKSVAFTSDAQPRWAKDWLAWEGFGKFWTQVIRWALRTEYATHLQTQVEIVQGEGNLTIDALDPEGRFLNFLQLKAVVVTPDLERIELSPRQTAPGRYEARFHARKTGAYLVSVVDESEDSSLQGSRDVTGIALSYPVEFKPSGNGPSLIKQLVETTRGRILEEEDDLVSIFRHDLTVRHSVVPIWKNLIWLVILLLPLDIAMRRLTLTSEQWRKMGGWLAFYRLFRTKRLATQPDITLSQLRQLKAGLKAESPDSSRKIQEVEQLREQLRQALDHRRSSSKQSSGRLASPVEPKSSAGEEKPSEETPASIYTRRLLDAKRRVKHRQREDSPEE